MKPKEEKIKIGKFKAEELAGRRVVYAGMAYQGSIELTLGSEGVFIAESVNSEEMRLFIEFQGQGEKPRREPISQRQYDKIQRNKAGFAITMK